MGKKNRHLFELLLTKLFWWLPNKLYLSLYYRIRLHRFPNLKNPIRYTEKLQWLKLYYHRQDLTHWVDKCEAKALAADIIGNEHIIPTYGVWDKFDDIDFDALPNSFVLKSTNGGGGCGVYICKNKKELDKAKARQRIELSQRSDIYKTLKEWPYKSVSHKIIAEQYMEDESGELRDYKYYCFHGEPKVMFVASNRYSNHNYNFFDMQFNKLPITSVMGAPSVESFQKPALFEEMKNIARKLSSGFPHVRVDLYCCNNTIYFGELTFFDTSGFDNMNSDKWDLIFGEWLSLPVKTM